MTRLKRWQQMRMAVGVLLCATLCAVIATEAGARVFRRWRGSGAITRTLEAIGGTAAYEATVSVNNGEGQLTVFGFAGPVAGVFRELRSVFGPETIAYRGGSMGMADIEANGQHARLIGIDLPDHAQALVLVIHMETDERRDARQAPDRHRLVELPEYPGSVPQFFARDQRAGLGMATAMAQAAPSDILAFYDTRLKRQGWHPVTPLGPDAAGPTTASPLMIYEKGRHVCAVWADPSIGMQGESHLVLLHKQPGRL